MILFSSQVVPKLEWTSDRAAIRAALIRDSGMERRSTALYDAIGFAILDAAARPSPHKLVIVATDGAENSSQCLRSSSQVVALARQHDVRIVMWGSLVADVSEMAALTAPTGGTFLYASSFADLEPSIEPLARALGNPTVLHVQNPSGQDAQSICLAATGGGPRVSPNPSLNELVPRPGGRHRTSRPPMRACELKISDDDA